MALPLIIAGVVVAAAVLSGCGEDDTQTSQNQDSGNGMPPTPKPDGGITTTPDGGTSTPDSGIQDAGPACGVDTFDLDCDGVPNDLDCAPQDKFVYPAYNGNPAAPHLVDGVSNDCSAQNTVRASSMGMIFTVPDSYKQVIDPRGLDRTLIKVLFNDLDQDGQLDRIISFANIITRPDGSLYGKEQVYIYPGTNPFIAGAKVFINPDATNPNELFTLIKPDGSAPENLGGIKIIGEDPDTGNQGITTSITVDHESDNGLIMSGNYQEGNTKQAYVTNFRPGATFQTPKIITIPKRLEANEAWLEENNAYVIAAQPNHRSFGYDLQVKSGNVIFSSVTNEGTLRKYHIVPLRETPPRYQQYDQIAGQKEFTIDTGSPAHQSFYSLALGDANGDGKLDAIAGHTEWATSYAIYDILRVPDGTNLMSAASLAGAQANYYQLVSDRLFTGVFEFANFNQGVGTEIVANQIGVGSFDQGFVQSIPNNLLMGHPIGSAVSLPEIESSTEIEGTQYDELGFLGFATIAQNATHQAANNTRNPLLIFNSRNGGQTIHVLTAKSMPLRASVEELNTEKIVSDTNDDVFGFTTSDNVGCDSTNCEIGIVDKMMNAYILPAR